MGVLDFGPALAYKLRAIVLVIFSFLATVSASPIKTFFPNLYFPPDYLFEDQTLAQTQSPHLRQFHPGSTWTENSLNCAWTLASWRSHPQMRIPTSRRAVFRSRVSLPLALSSTARLSLCQRILTRFTLALSVWKSMMPCGLVLFACLVQPLKGSLLNLYLVSCWKFSTHAWWVTVLFERLD